MLHNEKVECMSMQEVARRAGVSQSTVSRVVNGRSFVNEATRARVHEAMKEVGYEALPPERRTGRNPKLESRANSGLLAVLVDPVGMRLHSEFVMKLYSAAQHEANREGYSTILHFYEADKQLPPVLEKVDGFLVVGMSASEPFPKGILSRPMVCLTSFWQQGATSILAGNDEVGELAALHLLERGHQRLAVFLAEAGNPSFSARGKAFQRAAKAAGAKVSNFGAAVPRRTEARIATVEDLESRMERLVDRFVAERPLATGVFCPSDAMTAMAYRLLAKRRLVVGQDVEFVSCDHEVGYLAGLCPRPATIDLGIDERAHLAVQHLTSAIRNNRAPGEVQLTVEPKLVPGD